MSGTRVRRRGPGSRADEHHPTRRELVDAAAIVAERDGLATLSVDSVTRTAGHAKETFYVHFADRSELLFDLHRRFHEELFQRIRESSADISAGPERAHDDHVIPRRMSTTGRCSFRAPTRARS